MTTRTIHARGREWTGEEWDAEQARLQAPTGRQRWLAHDQYDSPFGYLTGPRDEFNYHAEAPLGRQCGTYFKTSLVHDGMQVWQWGGVHPIDLANGVVAN